MEQRIGIERMEEAINLFGSFDENIRLLETEFQVQVVNRGGELVVSGEPENVMLAVKAVQALLTLSNKGESISDQHVRYVIGLVRSGQSERISELTQDVICITSKGRPVKPKTIGQKQYVDAILKDTVTIGVGPAGTGKTYLAVAAAVAAFRDKQVNRIILTRPAVEAGERLGFLPGDLTGIFGMPNMSGVGISFGADRIYDVMTGLSLFPEEVNSSTRVLFVNLGAEEEAAVLPLLRQLRGREIAAEIYPEAGKMKKQMEYANRRGIPYVVIVGSQELEAGAATVKDMRTGEQRQVLLDKLATEICNS